jgi:hypothetical protein
VEALTRFALAVDDGGAQHGGLSAPNSKALRELAAEDECRERSCWENPIGDTHTFGAMTLLADYVRTPEIRPSRGEATSASTLARLP